MSFDLRLILGASMMTAALAAGGAMAQTAATEKPAEPAAAPAATAPAAAAPATAEAKPAADAKPAAEPAILPDIPVGSADAPLTIVEYASFTCSHCAAFHEENWPKLKAEYIDTGKVRFIQRDVYFDAIGLWAGVLARCAGDDKYYPVGDMLFAEQKQWLSAKTGEEFAANLRKIGAKAGMTTEQMDACWADEAKVASLVATFQKNATADKIEATPTFIIGGESVANEPWDKMKAKIDAKLAEAEKAAPAAAAPAPAAAPATTPAPASN